MIAILGETYDSMLGVRANLDKDTDVDLPFLVLDLPVFGGKLRGEDVVCVTSGSTNYLSLASALRCIDTYHPTEIFILGEASAISPLLHLGDVVIGNRVFIHGVNFHAQGLTYGTIPGLQPFFYSNIDLARTFEELSASFRDIATIRGDMISGEKKIADQEEFVSIVLSRYAGVAHIAGYDCNSAGVAIACEICKVPFLPLRAITLMPGEGEPALLKERRVSLTANETVAKLLISYIKAKGEQK